MQQLTIDEMPPKDAITVLFSLLCAQQWKKIGQIFRHFESHARRIQQDPRSASNVIVVPEGSSMTHELEMRAKDRFYASAVDVNSIGAVLMRFGELCAAGGEIAPGVRPLDCLCSFYGMLPLSLLHHPVLLSVMLLPSWSRRRVRTCGDVNQSIQDLCADRTECIDETLFNDASGMALIHYLIFRKKFPQSQRSFEVFRQDLRHVCLGVVECRIGDTTANLLHALSSEFLNPIGFFAVYHDAQIAPRLRFTFLLSIVHFLSISAAASWKTAWDLLENIRDKVSPGEDLSAFFSLCRACVARLAAQNGDIADALRICNESGGGETLPHNHLMCSFGIAAARLKLESPPRVLRSDTIDTQKVRYSIEKADENVKNALTFASCIAQLNQSNVQMPTRWVQMLLPDKFSPNADKLCAEFIRISQKKLTNGDIRTISAIFKESGSASNLKMLAQGLVYFDGNEKSGEVQQTIDLFEKWEIFGNRCPSSSINTSISLGTVTILIDSCLRVGKCDDCAFDLFWRFIFPSFRAHFNKKKNTVDGPWKWISSPDTPNDANMFAVGLATCMRLHMTKPIEIILRYILDGGLSQEAERHLSLHPAERDYIESHYGPSNDALSHPMGYTVYRPSSRSSTQSSFAFVQSVLMITRSYLSDAQSAKLRNFLESLDEVEGMDGVTMNGEWISLSKAYDLCSGRFPRSLLN